MAIDYSKWDKIELSDDSDIEVHPNVDKNSFIRWKQRDIHEKRIQRNNEIKGLEIQKEMYTHLNKRVDNMIKALGTDLPDESKRNKYLRDNFDPEEKCQIEQDSDNPPYNEMVEDLFIQITEDIKKEGLDPMDQQTLLAKVMEHRAKISSVLLQIDPKLEELNKEKHRLISSEDIHDAWNSSFINKKESAPTSSSTSNSETKTGSTAATASTVQSIQTINTPSSKNSQVPSKPLDQLDELELLEETAEFAKISADKLLKSIKFLEDHLYIVCEQQKDALMMSSFESQLDGDSKTTKQTIHQALILQYLNDLFVAAGGNKASPKAKEQAIGMFIGKLLDKNSAASKAFEADLKQTFEHIVKRCSILKEEQANKQPTVINEDGQEGVEQIQLRSMDPNSELVVNVPAEGTEEYEIFRTLPELMQKALLTESLDEINKVFATMSVPDAEKVLEIFDQCGAISISALLENEDEFEQLKGELEGAEGVERNLEELELEKDDDVVVSPTPAAQSTVDIVD